MAMMDKVNTWIHPLMVKYSCRNNRKILGRLEKNRPDLFAPIAVDVEEKHLALWGKLGLPVSVKWCRFFSNISGRPDPNYCPEDLYYARIERILNNANLSGVGCEDKNELDLYVDSKYTPDVILRFIRGVFLDECYKYISENDVNRLLTTDSGILIGKVASGSLGGHGVEAYSFKDGHYVNGRCLTKEFIEATFDSFVLQKRIEQSEFSEQFNPSSANTCRMVTLRCPWDGKVVLLKTAMRIGVTKSCVDNLSSGGITCDIDEEGNMSKYAYTWFKNSPLKRFESHPSTGVVFEGKRHPDFARMKELVIKAAERIPYMNILGWDVLVEKGGKIRILEVNSMCLGMDWLQYDFGGLFGDYTERVIDWCSNHIRYDKFSHLRTWL